MSKVLDKYEIEDLLLTTYGLCEYDDAKHEYKVNGKVRTSVTKKKSALGEGFSTEIRRKYAEKNGLSEVEVQAQWDGITQAGTMMHELLEACLFQGEIQRPTNHGQYNEHAHARYAKLREMGVPAKMLKAFESMDLVPIAAEFRVWCATTAGTLDLLAWDKTNEFYVVVDWKTNAKAGFSDVGPWTKQLKAPFHLHKATKLNEFSVQLESYAAILRSLGLEVGPSVVIHGYIDVRDQSRVDVHECLDFDEECAHWLSLKETAECGDCGEIKVLHKVDHNHHDELCDSCASWHHCIDCGARISVFSGQEQCYECYSGGCPD